jgi:hypothetical protein
VLGWQARDQLADPAELLERGLHLARERRIFEYLAGVGVGDRLSVADERLALLCQPPEGLLDVVEAGQRALAFRGEQVYAVEVPSASARSAAGMTGRMSLMSVLPSGA